MAFDALNADQRGGMSFNGKPSLTVAQAAERLTRIGMSWSGEPGAATTVSYAFRSSAPAEMIEDATGFERFSAQQIRAAEKALERWSDVANIRFVRQTGGDGGDGTYSNDATILFGNYTGGVEGATAFAVLPGNRASSSATGDIWVNSTQRENRSVGQSYDYGFLTLLHEIGHAIGLTHPSDYDIGEDVEDITYARDAGYHEDSLGYSVMSYFDITDTGGTSRGLQSPAGPLIDDIAAVQRLYGANMSANAANTTYGYVVGSINFSPLSQYLQSTSISVPIWGTIWDAGGTDTLNFSLAGSAQKIDLRPGAFSNVLGGVGNLSIALGVTIENANGGNYDDLIVGNDAANVLRGNGGNDRLIGGLSANTYAGGAGADRAVLNGNVGDFSLIDGGATGLLLVAGNGSGNQWIDGTTETVEFRNGQFLSLRDVSAYVRSAPLPAGAVQLAPADGYANLRGGDGTDLVLVSGNVGDYRLGRASGELSLNVRDGMSELRLAGSIDQVHFANGQYLSLRDLSAYVSAEAVETYAGDDILRQTSRDGHRFYFGGVGSDTVQLDGRPGDYVVRAFAGETPRFNIDPIFGNVPYEGVLLTPKSGGASVLIDRSVERVRFAGEAEYALGEIGARVAAGGPSGDRFLFLADTDRSRIAGGAGFGVVEFQGTAADDRVLLGGNVADFTLGRSEASGAFWLSNAGGIFSIAANVDAVHFANGQYLSLQHLGSYVKGSAALTVGTFSDDLLIPNASGAMQEVTGGNGFDRLYLPFNVGDLRLRPFTTGRTEGSELIARSGAGDFLVDRSVEQIHFANGQYLSFEHLGAYVDPFLM